MLYLIEDSELSRRAIGKYIDVYHYPDGRKELRLNGTLLPYSTYDRLSRNRPRGAIVDNKRLGEPRVYQSGAGASGITRALSQFPLENGPSDDSQSRKEEIPALTE